MAVTIQKPGELLPDWHPLKGTHIIFGVKPPRNLKDRKQDNDQDREIRDEQLCNRDKESDHEL